MEVYLNPLLTSCLGSFNVSFEFGSGRAPLYSITRPKGSLSVSQHLDLMGLACINLDVLPHSDSVIIVLDVTKQSSMNFQFIIF